MNISIQANYIQLKLAFVNTRSTAIEYGTYQGEEAITMLGQVVEHTLHTMDGDVLQSIYLAATEVFVEDEREALTLIIEENKPL